MSGGANNSPRTQDMAPEFAARVLHGVPMSKHTSWHVGGPADLFFVPRDTADLAAFIRQIRGYAAAVDRSRQQSAGA